MPYRSARSFCLFLAILVLGHACIERYDLPKFPQTPQLVVDGLITNEPGPYRITLTESLDLNTLVNKTVEVRQATVTIFDDQGNSEVFTEKKPGQYETAPDGIRGIVGRKYHINIRTKDGANYATLPQRLSMPGKIENLRFEIRRNSINPMDLSKPQDAVVFFIDAKGNPEEANRFRWRWTSTYQIINEPWKKTRQAGRPPIFIPNPPPCSGVRLGPYGLEAAGECTCCNCWVSKSNEAALISDNRFVSALNFRDVRIATVPVEPRTFDIRFHFRVDQLSVSEEVFTFWKLVQAQQSGEGSLFQPNSIRIKGNVFSTTNPGEDVLGIFSVSGIHSVDTFLMKRQVPIGVEVETVAESCLYFPGATNERPSFW
ncbi:MAG TPA: DUF4249 domain-containing protein [Chryseosolibacter sp.]